MSDNNVIEVKPGMLADYHRQTVTIMGSADSRDRVPIMLPASSAEPKGVWKTVQISQLQNIRTLSRKK